MDAHFYIFEKWVVDFIAQDNSFSALKGEVLPYLVKKQFSKANISKQNDEEEEIKKVTFELGGFESFIKTDELEEQKQKLSSWNDHSGDLKGAYHNRMLKCFAYVIGEIFPQFFKISNFGKGIQDSVAQFLIH